MGLLRCYTAITFQQVPTTAFPDRNYSFTMPFVTECEINSSWKNLTDTCRIKFPKKLFFKDQNSNVFDLNGRNLVMPFGRLSDNAPFFLRGDKITIKAGYKFYPPNSKIEKLVTNTIFSGYVTMINPRMPVQVECEDNMYILKQVWAQNKSYTASQSLESDIIPDLVKTANAVTKQNFVYVPPLGPKDSFGEEFQTTFGGFRIQNESISQVLERLRRDYYIESYFIGNNLYSSGLVYYPAPNATPFNFIFQNNIISDELKYTRIDDIKIAIRAYSVNQINKTTTNKNGTNQTQQQRLDCIVTRNTTGGNVPAGWNDGGNGVIWRDLSATGDSGIDTMSTGEIRTQYFWNVTDINDLVSKAASRLNRFYYEGFRGHFTTFGLPQVKHGDLVTISDNVLTERKGTYFVKSVITTTGTGGMRQKIELDFRVDNNGIINQSYLNNGA